jgi:hypothetical protein
MEGGQKGHVRKVMNPARPAAKRLPTSAINAGCSQFSHWLPWGAVLLIILFVGAIRVRLLEIPLERDEGEYAYIAQLMLQGVPPYQAAYTMKLPGTPAACALSMLVFGQTTVGIHLGLLLTNAATIVLVFLLGRRLLDVWAGVAAAAAYALLSLSPGVMGLAAHATHFVMLPAVGGTLLLWRALQTRRASAFCLSGLLFGAAFLMKQAGAFFGLFGWLLLLWNEVRHRPIYLAGGVKRTLVFMSGLLLPWLLTCLILWRLGVLRQFWFFTVQYAREYGAQQSMSAGWQDLCTTLPFVIRPNAGLWVLGCVGLFFTCSARNLSEIRIFLAGFLCCSFLAVCPGLYFRGHYFILLLPALALLIGVAISEGRRRFLSRTALRVWVHLPFGLLMLALGYSVIQQRAIWFQLSPAQVCRKVYLQNPFPESLVIADYIRHHSSDNARVAVLGSEPQIYFYSRRRGATGYIYTYPLLERQPHAARMEAEMIHEIEAARPEFLVLVRIGWSWESSSQLKPGRVVKVFDWSQRFVTEHYDRVGVIDIISPNRTEYRWDAEAAAYQPESPDTVLVFRRKLTSVTR